MMPTIFFAVAHFKVANEAVNGVHLKVCCLSHPDFGVQRCHALSDEWTCRPIQLLFLENLLNTAVTQQVLRSYYT